VKTRKKKQGYLLLHQSGQFLHTDDLNFSVDGILAIINLATLEQYNGVSWERVPTDLVFDTQQPSELETEIEAEKEANFGDLQTGATRLFSPYVIWAYCSGNLN